MVDITKIDSFVRSSPNPAWLATRTGDCLYTNPALERLTGLNWDQIDHADWRNFLLEEDQVAATAAWERSLATGTPYRTQVRMRRFDGTPAIVELFAFGHKLSNETELWLFTGFHVNGDPQQPRPLETQLQATLNVLPAYTWYGLPSGGLTFVNERSADYLGLPKDHPLRFGIDIGAEWDSHIPLLHPDDHEQARRVWATCLRTGSASEVTFRVRNAEGGYRWFLSRAEPLRASDGTLLYWIGVNLDIEDRKRAEEKLQQSQFHLAEGQRLAHMGSWAAFNAAGFEYWSSELFRIHGLDPCGKPPTIKEYLALVHPEDREFMAQGIQKMLVDHRSFDFTKRIVRPDGEIRRIRCVGVPDTRGETFQGFLGTGMDVTEEEQLTEELRRSEYYLAEGQRLAQMGSWGFDPAGFFSYWSRELFQIYGLDPAKEAPSLQEYLAYIHPQDREFMASVMKRMVADASGCDVTKRIVRSNGEVRYVRCVSAPVVEDGTLKGIVGNAIDVTEHELLTQELRRHEAYLAEAQRLSHTGSFGWSVSSGEIFWSEETFQIFEYDRGTKPTVELVLQRVHPEDRVLAQQTIERASEDAKDFDFEHRLLLPDRSIKHLRVVAHALGDESDSTEFVGAVMDITVAKQAEDRIRLIINTVPGLLWSARPDGWVDFINQRWLDYTGMPLEQGLGWGWAAAYHPDELDQVQIKWRAAVAEGKPLEIETRLRRFDGEYRWFLERVFPLFDRTGHILGWYGSDIDIHERKLAEEKIREQEMELRQILDLAPQLVSVFGPNRERLYANRRVLDYLGVGHDEWLQRGPLTSIHPDDWERVKTGWDRALGRGSSYEVELRLRKHDGSYRWFLARYNPVRDDKGRIMRWYVAGTDIEERKEAEERLHNENIALREEISKASMFEEIVGSSPGLQRVLSRISKVAPATSTVLITGETGTGKELIARAVHRRSQRCSHPFVSVNCAAIPRDLIASELFGHEKGAFTGALQRRLGKFELAEGGTIFLDEIGELPAETQIALLRVLQEHEFERVGGNQAIRTNVRVVAATNRDLQAAIAAGIFRSDLFYRLNVFPIEVPPLRERKDDIAMLVEYFIDRFARQAGRKITSIEKKTLELIQAYAWPGNIRELQNVIERSVVLCETEIFSVDESWLSRASSSPQKQSPMLSKKPVLQEKEIIEAALAEASGRVSGPAGAAAKLGIPSTTLESKIKSLKINKHHFKKAS